MELQLKNKCVFIRGNHDDLLMEWLRGKDNELWHQHGGEATILAYQNLTLESKTIHIDFLASLRNYYLDNEKLGFSLLKIYWHFREFKKILALPKTYYHMYKHSQKTQVQ